MVRLDKVQKRGVPRGRSACISHDSDSEVVDVLFVGHIFKRVLIHYPLIESLTPGNLFEFLTMQFRFVERHDREIGHVFRKTETDSTFDLLSDSSV